MLVEIILIGVVIGVMFFIGYILGYTRDKTSDELLRSLIQRYVKDIEQYVIMISILRDIVSQIESIDGVKAVVKYDDEEIDIMENTLKRLEYLKITMTGLIPVLGRYRMLITTKEDGDDYEFKGVSQHLIDYVVNEIADNE